MLATCSQATTNAAELRAIRVGGDASGRVRLGAVIAPSQRTERRIRPPQPPRAGRLPVTTWRNGERRVPAPEHRSAHAVPLRWVPRTETGTAGAHRRDRAAAGPRRVEL